MTRSPASPPAPGCRSRSSTHSPAGAATARPERGASTLRSSGTGGRVAEGTRLLSEYGVYSSIAGSNPALSVGANAPRVTGGVRLVRAEARERGLCLRLFGAGLLARADGRPVALLGGLGEPPRALSLRSGGAVGDAVVAAVERTEPVHVRVGEPDGFMGLLERDPGRRARVRGRGWRRRS